MPEGSQKQRSSKFLLIFIEVKVFLKVQNFRLDADLFQFAILKNNCQVLKLVFLWCFDEMVEIVNDF